MDFAGLRRLLDEAHSSPEATAQRMQALGVQGDQARELCGALGALRAPFQQMCQEELPAAYSLARANGSMPLLLQWLVDREDPVADFLEEVAA